MTRRKEGENASKKSEIKFEESSKHQNVDSNMAESNRQEEERGKKILEIK